MQANIGLRLTVSLVTLEMKIGIISRQLNIGDLHHMPADLCTIDFDKLAQAEEMYERALAGCEKALLLETIPALNTVGNLGRLYHWQGRMDEAKEMFHDRNLDAHPPSGLRDLAPLLLRLARVRLNVGSGSAGPAHLADQIGAVAQKSSLFQTVKF